MSRLILENANLLDGDNPPRRATVVVSGKTIESVQDQTGTGAITSQPGDRRIDLGGRTLMPGMILGHYHSAYHHTGGSGKPLGLEAPPAVTPP